MTKVRSVLFTNGGVRYSWPGAFPRFLIDALTRSLCELEISFRIRGFQMVRSKSTYFIKLYRSTLNVKVGPVGNLAIRRCMFAASVNVKIMICVTPKGCAMTK